MIQPCGRRFGTSACYAPIAAHSVAAPPVQVARPDKRDKSEPRGKFEERGKPDQPPVATPAKPSAPPVAAAPPEQHRKPEPRGNERKADTDKNGVKKSDEQAKLDEEEKRRKP